MSIFFQTLLFALNLVLAMINYGSGSYAVAMFNSGVAGFCLMAALASAHRQRG